MYFADKKPKVYTNKQVFKHEQKALRAQEKKKYEYKLVKVEVQPKTGEVVIHRNFNVTTLTLITCTNNDSKTQSIYIFEIV